jgi:serine/threonine protein kinase
MRIQEDGIDLLCKMLTYDPSKRITAQVALLHPYFNDIKKEDLTKYSYFE